MCGCEDDHVGVRCGGDGCNCHPAILKMGDHIEVYGQRFVLVSLEVIYNEPAIVTFKQPIELMEE